MNLRLQIMHSGNANVFIVLFKIKLYLKFNKIHKGNFKMTFASSTINLSQLIPSTEIFSTLWKNVNQSLQSRKKCRQTIKELNQLTNKDLADIGLCRGDISAVANGCIDHLIKRGVNIDYSYFNSVKIKSN